MKRKTKKYLSFLLIVLLMICFTIPAFANTESDEKAESNWVLKILGSLCYGLGIILQKLFFSDDGTSLNALVYNQGGQGLMLSKSSTLRDFFVSFYMLFYYMAIMFFVPMGLWVGTYFARAGDDSQKRAILKDKIFKMFTTIVLLSAMPTILEMMFAFNDALVGIFYSVVTNLFATANADGVITAPENALLLDLLKEQASSADKTVGHQFGYLMAVVINLWLIFYYFIRDITIGFLFLLFPILAIFYPFVPSMIMTWFKEMASNIGTQTIHAGIFAVVIAMATNLPFSFYNTMFILTAFASVIPMTGIIKRLFGMEGNIGGASSVAGMAMMYGAYRLGSGAVRGIGQKGAESLEGYREYKTVSNEETLLRKGHATASDNDRELTSPDLQKNLANLQERKAIARRKMYRGSLGAVGGVTAGLPGTIGGLALGSSQAVMMGAGLSKLGNVTGTGIGYAGSTAHNVGSGYFSTKAEEREDLTLEQIEMEQDGGRIVGDFQHDEKILEQRKAIRKQKMYQSMGMPLKAQTAYAKAMPKNATPQEIGNLENPKFYQDANRSLIFTEKEDGSKTIHWLGDGNSEITQPLVSSINKDYGGSISPSIEKEFYDQAENHAKMTAKTDDPKNPLYVQSRNSEYRRLLKEHETQALNFQRTTGIKNMTLGTIPAHYQEGQFSSVVGDVQIPSTVDFSKMKEIMIDGKEVGEEYFNDGYGIGVTTRDANVIFKNNEIGGLIRIATAPGDESLGTNTTQYSKVAFQDGKVLQEKIQYALHDNALDLDTRNKVAFNTNKLPTLASRIPANSEVIVTINNPTGVDGTYDVYDTTSHEYIGSELIPDNFNELNGEIYHITVDVDRNFTQYGENKQMTTRDVAIIEGINRREMMEAKANQERLAEIQALKAKLTQTYNSHFTKLEPYNAEIDINGIIDGS